MATTSNWDTDTSTGGRGFSRLWVKDGSTWDRANVMNVKVAGDWKFVRKVWTKVSGTWKPVMCVPEIDEVIDLGTLNFTSRDNASANCQGWFKYVGGDLTSSSSWESRVTVSQASGGFSSDTGWVSGMASAVANQAQGAFKLPHPTDYNSGGSAYASEYGACTPVLHGGGSHSGSYWVVRACYCNTDLSKSETSASSYNPWGYTIF